MRVTAVALLPLLAAAVSCSSDATPLLGSLRAGGAGNEGVGGGGAGTGGGAGVSATAGANDAGASGEGQAGAPMYASCVGKACGTPCGPAGVAAACDGGYFCNGAGACTRICGTIHPLDVLCGASGGAGHGGAPDGGGAAGGAAAGGGGANGGEGGNGGVGGAPEPCAGKECGALCDDSGRICTLDGQCVLPSSQPGGGIVCSGDGQCTGSPCGTPCFKGKVVCDGAAYCTPEGTCELDCGHGPPNPSTVFCNGECNALPCGASCDLGVGICTAGHLCEAGGAPGCAGSGGATGGAGTGGGGTAGSGP